MENTTNRINDVIKKLYPKDFEPPRKKRRLVKFEDRKTVLIAGVFCLVMLVMLTFVFAHSYNRFITLQTDAMTADAQIRAYLQKRGNIVTNLTRMVIDYAEHEKILYKYTADVRKEVITQTDTLLNAAKDLDMAGIDDKEFLKFEGLLSKFMAWSESYPDLKLGANFQDFMREIVAVETNIADARVQYNNTVNIYSTYRAKFPNYIFARIFRFGPLEFYKGNEEFQKFKEIKY